MSEKLVVSLDDDLATISIIEDDDVLYNHSRRILSAEDKSALMLNIKSMLKIYGFELVFDDGDNRINVSVEFISSMIEQMKYEERDDDPFTL